MLDSRREKFAQGVADGLCLADAYRAANEKQAERWKPETVWQQASRWMANVEVAARIEALRAELAEKSLWKREDSVNQLLANIADPEAKVADKNAAVKILNEMHGYNAPQEIKHSGNVPMTLVIRGVKPSE